MAVALRALVFEAAQPASVGVLFKPWSLWGAVEVWCRVLQKFNVELYFFFANFVNFTQAYSIYYIFIFHVFLNVISNLFKFSS